MSDAEEKRLRADEFVREWLWASPDRQAEAVMSDTKCDMIKMIEDRDDH